MISFTVNSKKVTAEEGTALLPFLRETLRLTSVKNGCSEGACGTCTILIDGKKVKACIMKVDRLEGKSVVTLEGLSERERDVYSFAFAEAGAVQCGFCIPGMVMCAKSLIDTVPDPTPDDVKKAIRGNICRCTGYVKIERAILLAASLIRGNVPVPERELTGLPGERMPRVDAKAKALGEAVYTDDMTLGSDMLYGGAVRSAYPRARIIKADVSEARALPGVVAVVTAKELPGVKKIGHLRRDWDVLIAEGETTRYLGDSIVFIAAESEKTLDEARKLVRIEYGPLAPVTSPEEAMTEGAPLVHEEGNLLAEERLVRGDVDAALAASAHVVSEEYELPFTEHAFLEPECALAKPNGDGTLTVYSSDQGSYQTRRECAEAAGLPEESVRVIGETVGGGFGGKEDMTTQHIASILAVITGRPVKVRFTRAESITVHPKRHAMKLVYTTGCDGEGNLTAVKAEIISDTGAYASLGGPVLQRACTHAAGPYRVPNVYVRGRAYYTNNPPAGAFRGFGVTQSCFAMECNLNRLARLVGLTPWEIRYKNAVRPGDALPNGQLCDDSTAIVECLEAVKDCFDGNEYTGVACAMKNSGLGVGIPDYGRCILSVEGGKIHTRIGAACIGQGLATVITQLICEIVELPPDMIIHELSDTGRAPNSGNTTASRQTVFAGEAAREAARKLKAELDSSRSLRELEGREYYGEYFGSTDPIGSPKEHPVSHVAYGYAAHVVILDADGRVKRVVAAHDVGRAINPMSIEGQIEGGVVMSMGYALTEDFPLDRCRPTAKFGTLGLLRSTDVPEITSIILGKNEGGLAGGAKGIGEICAIPTAPALQLAYERLDGRFRTKLPLEKTAYRK